MIRLPVSAYWRDAYFAEREEVRRLTDQLVRLQRKEAGLPEVTPQPRAARDPMPREVTELVLAWDSPETQAVERAKAERLYEQTRDWSKVAELLAVEEGE